MSTPVGPFGNICVQRRRFDVSLIVTCEGANGLINARPGRSGDEAWFRGVCRRVCFSNGPIFSEMFGEFVRTKLASTFTVPWWISGSDIFRRTTGFGDVRLFSSSGVLLVPNSSMLGTDDFLLRCVRCNELKENWYRYCKQWWTFIGIGDWEAIQLSMNKWKSAYHVPWACGIVKICASYAS